MKTTTALTIICVTAWIITGILVEEAFHYTSDPGCLIALLIPTFITVPCIVFMSEDKWQRNHIILK